MIKKITKRYNKKLSVEFKKMKSFKEDFNLKLTYSSGVNSISHITKEEAIKLAETFDKNPNRWKKYIRRIPVSGHP